MHWHPSVILGITPTVDGWISLFNLHTPSVGTWSHDYCIIHFPRYRNFSTEEISDLLDMVFKCSNRSNLHILMGFFSSTRYSLSGVLWKQQFSMMASNRASSRHASATHVTTNDHPFSNTDFTNSFCFKPTSKSFHTFVSNFCTSVLLVICSKNEKSYLSDSTAPLSDTPR